MDSESTSYDIPCNVYILEFFDLTFCTDSLTNPLLFKSSTDIEPKTPLPKLTLGLTTFLGSLLLALGEEYVVPCLISSNDFTDIAGPSFSSLIESFGLSSSSSLAIALSTGAIPEVSLK